jgi:hypothetical protein
MRGTFDERDFERRPDVPFHQMAAARGAVALPQHNVRMHSGGLILDRDRTGKRQHLDLLGDGDAFVPTTVPVEIRDGRAGERANRGEVTR